MGKIKNKNLNVNNRLWELLPLMGVLFLVPLIVQIKIFNLSGYIYENWNGDKNFADLFSFYKSQVLLFFTAIVVVIYIFKLYREGLKNIKSILFSVPLWIYGIFIFLSSIYSKHGEVAYFGNVDRSEGMFVLLSYCLLCLYTFNVVDTVKKARYILYSLLLSSLIIGIIGIFQYMGYDLFKSEFGKKLILGGYYEAVKDQINFTVSNNAIYATLFHFDYVGSFSAIMVPLLMVLSIFTKQRQYKMIYGCLFLIAVFLLFGSYARSGWLGVSFSILIFIFLSSKTIFSNKKNVVIVISVLVIASGLIGILAKDALKYRFYNTKQDLQNLLSNESEKIKEDETNAPLRSVLVNGSEATIVSRTETLKIRLDKEYALSFFDDKNNEIPFEVNEKTMKLQLLKETYKDFDITGGTFGKEVRLTVRRTRLELFFRLDNDQIKLINRQGKELIIGPVEKWGFEGQEKFASARGYIWSRTFPLLKNTFFIGYGPDNYLYYFPQNDFYGKLNVYNDMWMLVDKPHNLYLQIAMNTGVVSLISILILFIMYGFYSFRLYYNCDMSEETNVYGLACFLGVSAYLVTSIFNDSVVGVAPVFWIVLGLGIAMNEIARSSKIRIEKV